ncbi:acylase [Sinorhizobium meliloti]|nr:acylase [Sinorhizobium meliloti]
MLAFQTLPGAVAEALVGPLAGPEALAQPTEILWDKFGVPHIFAADDISLARAFGWCQAHSHGDLLLRLFGRARARAAEYWGRGEQDWQLESDRRILRLGVPARAREWYDANYQSARAILDAFAAGINDYGVKHAYNLDSEVRQVLPVSGVDVLAHLQVAIHFHFVFQPDTFFQRGSNGWAIAPSQSASGDAMLLVNPHTPWTDLYTWYEAHLVAEQVGLNFYGAAFVGLPFLCVGFNRNLGWTHTVNTMDGADMFGLKPRGGGYAWDNADGKLPFVTTEHTIRVKQQNGSFTKEHLVVRSSVHGPIIIEDTQTPICLRVVGLDQPFVCAQYWDMMHATNLAEFEAAIRHLQNPIFMVIYADRDGHIMSLFGGRNPKRMQGDWSFWLGLVPGWESRYLWTDTFAYDELPKVVDPVAGWVQNANDPPWWTTLPSPLDPTRFPPSFAPRFLHLRAQQSIKMLQQNPNLTLDRMAALKLDSTVPLAERILDDLLAAARQQGGDLIKAAVKVLDHWDRKTDTGSRGAVLFAAWAALMPWDTDGFATPWSETELLSTPKGLRSPVVAVSKLEAAARQLVNDYEAVADDPGPALTLDQQFWALAIPWGEVFRLRRDDVDLPANGAGEALGAFRTVEYQPIADSAPRRFQAVSGDSFVAVVEFSDPPRALVLLGYGNASQRGSPHRIDQLELMSRGEFRQAWFARSDIEANLERREQL